MSRFRKKTATGTPAISTSSMPDIVFMLLFFFMVATVMRETTLKVANKLPDATEVEKLERKSLVAYIYIGRPLKTEYGTEARIQLNDAIAGVENVREFIELEREKIIEAERQLMTTSLKVDVETKMGVVSKVKQELRKVNALKINYSSRKKGGPLPASP